LLPALSQWLLHTPVSSLARLALVIVAGQLYDESGKPYLPGLLPDRSEVVRLLSGSLVGSESEATVLLSELGAAGVLTWVKRKVVAIYCDYCERNITAARYFGAGGEYLLARCRAAEMSAACQRSRPTPSGGAAAGAGAGAAAGGDSSGAGGVGGVEGTVRQPLPLLRGSGGRWGGTDCRPHCAAE